MNKRLSDRVMNIKPSATMSLNAKTKIMVKEGKDIINMSVGEPDLHPPLTASYAGIQAIVKGKTGYTPAAGLIELRESIVRYLLNERGLEYKPNQIIASAGENSRYIMFFKQFVIKTTKLSSLHLTGYLIRNKSNCRGRFLLL
ncbi:aminotransferase class I/II-fold pyridoxal phosphate-dependent enzyme [Bacillus velezensis]|uniref:aminotransferase class I/II-fold pyridoxal phosphate-dependent enzyme n=1 Tax=Bacillus velezensis TaxID=492670 RepID=UPI003CF2D421